MITNHGLITSDAMTPLSSYASCCNYPLLDASRNFLQKHSCLQPPFNKIRTMTMHAQAVLVLQQEACDTPLPGDAQQSLSSPLNVLATACIEMTTRQADPAPDDDESGPSLPIPANGLFGVHRKPEAARILTATQKGSLLRSQTKHEMIKQGYAPASPRTLQRLVQSHADGKVTPDIEWESRAFKSPPPQTCRGIQSSSLDMHAPPHPEHCRKASWSIEVDGQWHSKGCTNAQVGSDSRCPQCRNQWKMIGVCRHPELFQPAKSPSLLPSKSVTGTVA